MKTLKEITESKSAAVEKTAPKAAVSKEIEISERQKSLLKEIRDDASKILNPSTRLDSKLSRACSLAVSDDSPDAYMEAISLLKESKTELADKYLVKLEHEEEKVIRLPYTAVAVPQETRTIKVELESKESAELRQLEEKIKKGFSDLLEIGKALKEINDKKLYRLEGFKTIKEYCKKKWGRSYRRIDQLIEGATVSENVNKSSHSPVKLANEAQARQLARLPEDEQPVVWAEIVESLPEGEAPTAKDVKEVVDKKLGVQPKEKAPETAPKAEGSEKKPAKYAMVDTKDFLEILSWVPKEHNRRLFKMAMDNDSSMRVLVNQHLADWDYMEGKVEGDRG